MCTSHGSACAGHKNNERSTQDCVVPLCKFCEVAHTTICEISCISHKILCVVGSAWGTHYFNYEQFLIYTLSL